MVKIPLRFSCRHFLSDWWDCPACCVWCNPGLWSKFYHSNWNPKTEFCTQIVREIAWNTWSYFGEICERTLELWARDAILCGELSGMICMSLEDKNFDSSANSGAWIVKFQKEERIFWLFELRLILVLAGDDESAVIGKISEQLKWNFCFAGLWMLVSWDSMMSWDLE